MVRRVLPALRNDLSWRLIADLSGLVVLGAVWWHIGTHPWPNDAWNFWVAWTKPEGLYGVPWLAPSRSFVYSPAYAQAWWPLQFVPWPIVSAAWSGLQLAALAWMLTPVGAVIALALPWPYLDGYGTAVYATVNNGNPMVLTAAAIVAGVRWPAAWSYVLLTKVSAGIGILYFVVRHEWRHAAIALGATAGIVLISFVIDPTLWWQWTADVLLPSALHSGSNEALGKEQFMPLPLAVRGPLGLGVVLLAGWRGWPWLVAVGCFLALPDIHLGGYTVLLASVALAIRGSSPTSGADSSRAGRAVERARPQLFI